MDAAAQYRLKNEQRLLKQHAKMMALGEKLIIDRYGRPASIEIIEQSTREYYKLLPEIPYIGGKANSMTDTLEQMTSLLALYRVLKADGRTVEEIGKLLYPLRLPVQAISYRSPIHFCPLTSPSESSNIHFRPNGRKQNDD